MPKRGKRRTHKPSKRRKPSKDKKREKLKKELLAKIKQDPTLITKLQQTDEGNALLYELGLIPKPEGARFGPSGLVDFGGGGSGGGVSTNYIEKIIKDAGGSSGGVTSSSGGGGGGKNETDKIVKEIEQDKDKELEEQRKHDFNVALLSTLAPLGKGFLDKLVDKGVVGKGIKSAKDTIVKGAKGIGKGAGKLIDKARNKFGKGKGGKGGKGKGKGGKDEEEKEDNVEDNKNVDGNPGEEENQKIPEAIDQNVNNKREGDNNKENEDENENNEDDENESKLLESDEDILENNENNDISDKNGDDIVNRNQGPLENNVKNDLGVNQDNIVESDVNLLESEQNSVNNVNNSLKSMNTTVNEGQNNITIPAQNTENDYQENTGGYTGGGSGGDTVINNDYGKNWNVGGSDNDNEPFNDDWNDSDLERNGDRGGGDGEEDGGEGDEDDFDGDLGLGEDSSLFEGIGLDDLLAAVVLSPVSKVIVPFRKGVTIKRLMEAYHMIPGSPNMPSKFRFFSKKGKHLLNSLRTPIYQITTIIDPKKLEKDVDVFVPTNYRIEKYLMKHKRIYRKKQNKTK